MPRNESPFDPDWIVRLRRALDKALPADDAKRLKIIAADDVKWGTSTMNFPGKRGGNICTVGKTTGVAPPPKAAADP